MNYQTRIMAAHAAGTIKRGQVTITEVRHDDWCPALHQGRCFCNPVVVINGREVLEDGTLGELVDRTHA